MVSNKGIDVAILMVFVPISTIGIFCGFFLKKEDEMQGAKIKCCLRDSIID
jgi:hypothetical protein